MRRRGNEEGKRGRLGETAATGRDPHQKFDKYSTDYRFMV